VKSHCGAGRLPTLKEQAYGRPQKFNATRRLVPHSAQEVALDSQGRGRQSARDAVRRRSALAVTKAKTQLRHDTFFSPAA
jgi:hypothetical protein